MRIEEKDGELVITDFNEVEAYKIACKIEKDGIEFYAKISGRVKDDKIKRTLSFLLNEEKKHLKFFEGQFFKVREREGDSSEEDDLLSSIDYGIFQPYQGVNGLEDVLKNPPRALRLGLILEDKSIKFYEHCRDSVSKEETKQEIAKILEEEQSHKQMLEDIVNNL